MQTTLTAHPTGSGSSRRRQQPARQHQARRLAGIAALVALATPWMPAATPPALATSRLAHVGLVVRDLARTARAWAEIFDVETTVARDDASPGFPKDYHGAPGATVKSVDVHMDNLVVELLQPRGGTSPWRDFLDRHGEGIHHLAFDVDDVEATVGTLERHGGHRTIGRPGRPAAFVDFDGQMGGGIEVIKPHAGAVTTGADTPRPTASVVAVGHLTRDAERAREFWAGVLGRDIPPARDTKGVPFPADCQCDRDAYIREVNIRLGTFGINLIQPVGGPSVWRRLIERHEGLDYLQFNVPDQPTLDNWVAFLLQHGGIRTLGEPGAPYAYIDMQERLALTLLLVKSPPPR